LFKKKDKTLRTDETAEARQLVGKIALIVTVLAVFTSLFHIWMNSLSLMEGIKRNALHLGLMLALTFLMYPASKKSSPKDCTTVLDWVLAVLGLSVGLYIYFFYDALIDRSMVVNNIDLMFAVLAIVLTLEAGRRAIGLLLPLLSIAFIIYAKYGYLFPGLFEHQGFEWGRILQRMYFTSEGLFGVTLQVSSSYVFMFILFGSFLNKTGTAKFFNNFALALAGWVRGGPAQVAILASGMMGTISGSSQANVATTGSFTIPLMKQVGYKPYFAGSVEAVASTGGILMPPIMGAASFIMASFLGIPYVKVMYAGILPALFYYFAISVMVDLRAKRIGLKGLPKKELPSLKETLLNGGHLFIPIVVILVFLLEGKTPLFSALMGLGAVILASAIRSTTRMSWKDLIDALAEGAKTAVGVAIACAVVGFIVGVVTMTGLGQIVALNIISLSMGKLWLALVMVMLSAIVLGMGLPAAACYIITASIAAPALIKMGVDPLAAHFFAFYFGTMSAVIPPVALTSYTAAGIAGARPTDVAFSGLKLASAGLIIPYMYVYNPILLMQGVTPGKLIIAAVSGLLGIYCLGVANEGYLFSTLQKWQRLIFLGAAITLIKPGITTDAAGISLLIVGIVSQWYNSRKQTPYAENI